GGSPYTSPKQSTGPNVVGELNALPHGLVHMGGHGNQWGVYRNYWEADKNGDGAVQNPTKPVGLPQKSQWEVAETGMFLVEAFWGGNGWPLAKARLGQGAVFVLAACSTGDHTEPNNLGASLLSNGTGVAWVGGIGTVGYSGGWTKPGDGAVQDFSYQ